MTDEPCDICTDGGNECDCEYEDFDGRCYQCGGSGWLIPDHCCACGGSPYCNCCRACGAECVAFCKCPIAVERADGSVTYV